MGILNIFQIRDIIDIILVAFVVYKLIRLIKDTRAMQLVKGILVLIVAAQLSDWLGLNTLNYILQNTMTLGVIALVVVFQPELRRALEQIGRGTFFDDILATEDAERQLRIKKMIDEICIAVGALSEEKIGALIIIEKQTKIGDIIRSGTELDAIVSAQILRNIFIPNTPLHDGAVVVRKDRIVAAACLLPLTDNLNINKSLGTRHRSAIGISENSDCISIVVSEETGTISVAIEGKLIRDFTVEELNQYLSKSLQDSGKQKKYKLYIKSKISLGKGRDKK